MAPLSAVNAASAAGSATAAAPSGMMQIPVMMGQMPAGGTTPAVGSAATATPSGMMQIPVMMGQMPTTTMPGMNPMMMGMNPMMNTMNPMAMGGVNPMMMGMNPMMSAMNPMGSMNPMSSMMMGMGMNPMMMGMQAMGADGLGGMGTSAVSSDAAAGTVAPTEDLTPVDGRVKELCKAFGIEHLCEKVQTCLRSREDFDNDVQALWHVMEKAVEANRKPSDVMLIKCREIDRGTFAGKDLLDPDIQRFSQKFNLDDRIFNRLIEMKRQRKDTWRQDLRDLDARLATAKRPAGLLVRLIEDLQDRGKLSAPPLNSGLPSGTVHVGGACYERNRQDREKPKSRSRSRDRRR